jgi:hypothetical protein
MREALAWKFVGLARIRRLGRLGIPKEPVHGPVLFVWTCNCSDTYLPIGPLPRYLGGNSRYLGN